MASSFKKLKMYLIQKNFLSKVCFCCSWCLRKSSSKNGRRLRKMSHKIRIAGEILKDKFDVYKMAVQMHSIIRN